MNRMPTELKMPTRLFLAVEETREQTGEEHVQEETRGHEQRMLDARRAFVPHQHEELAERTVGVLARAR